MEGQGCWWWVWREAGAIWDVESTGLGVGLCVGRGGAEISRDLVSGLRSRTMEVPLSEAETPGRSRFGAGEGQSSVQTRQVWGL